MVDVKKAVGTGCAECIEYRSHIHIAVVQSLQAHSPVATAFGKAFGRRSGRFAVIPGITAFLTLSEQSL